MKRNRLFFKLLANREKALAMNYSLASLLNMALREISGKTQLTQLQKNYLVVETGYVYQHFGFAVFGPQARMFLASNLSECCGVPEAILQNWFETIAYMLLEDFNILKIVTGEPDWDAVDKAFFRDFARRVLCAEALENSDFGLEPWNENFINNLCTQSVKWIEEAQKVGVGSIVPEILASLKENQFAGALAKSLAENLEVVSKNMLQILVWRIQFLTSFGDIRQEAKFIVRGNSPEQEQKATKLAALLAMFLPHEDGSGNSLLPPSPLSISQLSGIFKDGFDSQFFDCSLFKNWLDLDLRNFNRDLLGLIAEAHSAGLLFEVPQGKNSKGYGLTLGALKILAPFHKMITKFLLKSEPKYHLAAGDSQLMFGEIG